MTPREEELLQTVDELRRENVLLRQKIDALVRRVFGSSSEAMDKHQLELLMGLAAAVVVPMTNPPSTPRKEPVAVRKERKDRLPENLPVVEEVALPRFGGQGMCNCVS